MTDDSDKSFWHRDLEFIQSTRSRRSATSRRFSSSVSSRAIPSAGSRRAFLARGLSDATSWRHNLRGRCLPTSATPASRPGPLSRSDPATVPAPLQDPVRSDHRGRQPQAGPPAQLPRGVAALDGPLGGLGHPRRHSHGASLSTRSIVPLERHAPSSVRFTSCSRSSICTRTAARSTKTPSSGSPPIRSSPATTWSSCSGRCGLLQRVQAGDIASPLLPVREIRLSIRDPSLPVRRESLRRGRLHVRGAARACLTLLSINEIFVVPPLVCRDAASARQPPCDQRRLVDTDRTRCAGSRVVRHGETPCTAKC